MSQPTQVWSCGGGTQSGAIAVLIAQGKLPRPDFAFMTDTGRERASTWPFVDGFIRPQLAVVGLELAVIKAVDFGASLDVIYISEAWRGGQNSVPNITQKAFWEFLGRMQPIHLEEADWRPVKIALHSRYPGKRVDVYAWNAVAALMVNGALEAFIPRSKLLRNQLEAGKSVMRVQELTEAMRPFDEWMRTGSGYVPADARTFFSEINKRHPGQFATLGNF